MNNVLGSQAVAFCRFGLACFAAAKEPALVYKLWPSGPVDCTVDTAATQQRAVRSIDDHVNGESGDVTFDD